VYLCDHKKFAIDRTRNRKKNAGKGTIRKVLFFS
jgi:hypothetical protein